jgi:hypothetical protein
MAPPSPLKTATLHPYYVYKSPNLLPEPLGISPSGQNFVSVNGNFVFVWSLKTGKLVVTFRPSTSPVSIFYNFWNFSELGSREG